MNRDSMTRYGLLLARGIIGGLFILSAGAKLASIGQFEITMIQQHLVSDRITAAYLARGFIVLELAIGLCFFQPGYLKRLVIPITAAMLVGFTGYLLYLQLFTEYRENCGCFGNLVQMTPVESIIKNIAMLVITGILYRFQPSDNPRWGWHASAAILAITTIFVVAAFPVRVIQQDDLRPLPSGIQEATSKPAIVEAPPSRFTKLEHQAPPNSGFTPTQGTCLTAFLSLSCDHCRAVTSELGELQRESSVALYGVFLGEPQEVAEFFSATGTQFPYLLIAPENFYEFIGAAPPRVYLLHEGAITAYWDFENFSIADIRALVLPTKRR